MLQATHCHLLMSARVLRGKDATIQVRHYQMLGRFGDLVMPPRPPTSVTSGQRENSQARSHHRCLVLRAEALGALFLIFLGVTIRFRLVTVPFASSGPFSLLGFVLVSLSVISDRLWTRTLQPGPAHHFLFHELSP